MKVPLLERITSKDPTEFKLIRPTGEVLFVYCAMDAVLYSVLTGERVEVETRIRGEVVRFPLSPESEMMISYVDPRYSNVLPSCSSTPSNLCPFLRFFNNAAEFEEWRKSLPPHVQDYVVLISVRDAFTVVEQFAIHLRAYHRFSSLGD